MSETSAMDCEPRETTLFENAEWRLSASGLEHKANGYFIGADQIGERRAGGEWTWPAHMDEKLWCEPASFRQAFAKALSAFGYRPNALAFKAARSASEGVSADLPGGQMRRLGAVAVSELAALYEAAAATSSTGWADYAVEISVTEPQRPMRRAA